MILPRCDDATRDAVKMLSDPPKDKSVGALNGTIIRLASAIHIVYAEEAKGNTTSWDDENVAQLGVCMLMFCELYKNYSGLYPERSSVELAIGYPES